MKRNRLLIGDALTRLRALPSESVDCVVTSPPYFGLRDYGVTGQLGQEPHIEQWVAGVLAVCRELHRVLSPHGSLWLNLGDAYSTHVSYGAPSKSLLLGPERVAQLLVADGWLLRNKVVWAKANPLPSPVRDRLTNSHEFVYFLTKQASYFFDLDAIREPLVSKHAPSGQYRVPQAVLGRLAGRRDGLAAMTRQGRKGHPLGKNPGDVWWVGSASYRGAHFATFPPKLIRRPILATCPPQVCVNCARPWRRSTRPVKVKAGRPEPRPFVPCGCQAPTRPGLVLDPFFGTGTVAAVAKEHGRDWLGIELNPAYKPLAESRLGVVL
jgi:DNA modification methylase